MSFDISEFISNFIRNKLLDAVPIEKRPVVKDGVVDISHNKKIPVDQSQNKAGQLDQSQNKKILIDHSQSNQNTSGQAEKDTQENSVETEKPDLIVREAEVEQSKSAKIPKSNSSHKRATAPPGPPPTKPSNKKLGKKQGNQSEREENPSEPKTFPKPLEKAKPAVGPQVVQNRNENDPTIATKNALPLEELTKGSSMSINERGILPKSIILPAQLKVTSSKISKTDLKDVEEERRSRDLIFKQALEYDQVKSRCDQLEREIAKLELELGPLSEFGQSGIKSEPIEPGQDAWGNEVRDVEELLVKEEVQLGGEEELKEDDGSEMEVDNVVEGEELWEEGNKTVPAGWKVSKANKFQSPEGFVFEARFVHFPISIFHLIILQHLPFLSRFAIIFFVCVQVKRHPVHAEQQLREGDDQADDIPLGGGGGVEEGGKLPSWLAGKALVEGHHRG